MKDDNKSLSFVEDTAVAPERLRDYIDRFLQIVRAHGTSAGVYAHASVGCLHVRPVVNLKTEAGVQTFESLANAVSDLVLEFGGALSGEHGDGLVRSPFMRKMFGPVLYEAFREIKRTFDPHGILNPGKIVDAPPLTANLRYGPAYRSRAPRDLVRLLGLGRHERRGRDVQRPRCLPQDARRDDVPVLHGDAGRSALHAGTREHAATRDGGTAGRIGARRRGRPRGAGPVPRVPCVQSRVSGRRGRRQVQERVSRRLLEATRHVAARAGARPCSRSLCLGEPDAWRGQRADRQRARSRAERAAARSSSRSRTSAMGISHAAGSMVRALSRNLWGRFRRRRSIEGGPATACFSTTPSPTTSIPRSDSPRVRCCEATGVSRWPGGERLLRPAADFAGVVERGARAGRAEHEVFQCDPWGGPWQVRLGA